MEPSREYMQYYGDDPDDSCSQGDQLIDVFRDCPSSRFDQSADCTEMNPYFTQSLQRSCQVISLAPILPKDRNQAQSMKTIKSTIRAQSKMPEIKEPLLKQCRKLRHKSDTKLCSISSSFQPTGQSVRSSGMNDYSDFYAKPNSKIELDINARR